MDELSAYLPQDRRRALARGEPLPERADGSALFADIAGFTPLTEQITQALGARRGIEELTVRINTVYEALVEAVERFGGSVISLAGDSLTCWFDAAAGPSSHRAVLCARAMQAAMQRFPDLALKVSVSTGSARRFATGDPQIRLLDALGGAPLARLAVSEHLAKPGEILLDQATIAQMKIPDPLVHRVGADERFFVLDPSFPWEGNGLTQNDTPANAPDGEMDPEVLRPWILPVVYQLASMGQGLLLTELRPTVALFVRFLGIDYDHDEQAGEKLNTVVADVQQIVERYEGTVLELTIGDKGSYLLASFGASRAHEDDPRRAVQAALEVRTSLSRRAFLDLIQLGASSGTMRVGAYGSPQRRSFGALGDEVNLAARLMSLAAPGEILVSQRMRKALVDEFAVEARPPVALKGKAEPVPVFAVVGLQPHRALRLQEPSYALPLVGRTRELQVLQEKLASALEGRGQIIGITAEAGLGKSRLVAEAIRLASRRSMAAFGGTCRSEGIRTPYAVWQDIWMAFFDLDASMPLRKQVRAIENELRDRAPEHVDALPLLGPILGLALPDNEFTRALPTKDRKSQLEAVLLECLESAAREAAQGSGGLLLVLEDLHWVDPVSFDLLELTARAIEELPVLVLLTYRPPDADPSQDPLRRLQALDSFTQLRLGELDPVEIEQAIRAKLAQLFPERGDAVPPLLIERIRARAQGNPFYAEELLNYLRDRGIDPRNEAALHSLELPTSLYSLILSRMDRLAASQQLSLKVASIIGRRFRFADLQSYHPSLGRGEQLRADLQELARLDLTPLETPDPDLTYLFKHLVTHEVAYESLAYATRAQLHGEYAQYLEGTYPELVDQLAPQLAHHFEHARNYEKARHHLQKAGEQAAASYANEEALAFFGRALELTPEGERRARFDTLLRRERVLDLLGRRAQQRQDLTELARLGGAFPDAPFLRAQVAARQAQLEIDAGNYAAAQSSAEAAVVELQANTPVQAEAQELLVDALLLGARAMFLAGESASARQQLETSLLQAREVRYARGEYNALAQLGTWQWSTGDYAAAMDLLREALDLVRQAHDTRRELDILNNLGIVAKARALYPEAIAFYDQAYRIARKIGDRSGEATLLNNLGSASLASGDFVQAGLYAQQAAAMAAEVNEPTLQGIALTNRGEAHRELGQYAMAQSVALEALALLRASRYRRGEAILLDNLGLAEFALGHYAQAREATEAAIAVAHEIGSRPTEASARAHLGRIWTGTGEYAMAEQTLLAAQEMADSLEDTSQLLEVQAARAELALARGSAQDAETATSCLQDLVVELLTDPPTDRSHLLPPWVYLICLRALRAREDPRAAQLAARAEAELRARSEKIADPTLRAEYLHAPDPRAILALAAAA